jgi:glycosyltransferase involved in cell wall biosynthesis
MSQIILSVVVPAFNESENIQPLYDALRPMLTKTVRAKYEIIFVDDGSSDDTSKIIAGLRTRNKRVKLVSFSRNFGKEIALAAGLQTANGDAVLMLDADGQHPIDRIPDFVAAWRAGAQVVVGIRQMNQNEGWVKKYGSKLFYYLFNKLSGVVMVPRSTDFRLIDRAVRNEFVKLEEPHTMTRGLIDWLGFKREYIEYTANARTAGEAGYKFNKLFRLAANSFVSLSPTPLYAFGYLGLFITSASLILGLCILIEQVLLNDPLHWNFTGTAMLSVLVLFLVGLVLISQGVLALYISAIHTQAKRRPLYVVDYRNSLGVTEK